MSTKVTIGFIGLGVMGYPMAGHLAGAGHDVRIYNRSAAKAERWLTQYPGHRAATPRAAADAADFVFTIVGNDDDVRSVAYGDDGLFAGVRPGAVFIDNTTTSAELARELAAAAAERDCGFVDAPVSGGQAGAEAGQLTVMAGGDAQAFAAAKPVISAYAKSIAHMGPAGRGQLTKMVNQICIAGVLQGLAEGLRFAELAGLELEDVVHVIAHGAAQSWQMDNRHTTMARGDFDFGFAVDLMRKDLDIVMRTGSALDAPLELTQMVDRFYADVQALGGGRWDTSSLIERLRR
ncbi:MAG: NAD(P)-dependent oxidoreductase [Gammaproteobacteria bacterium]